MRPAEIRTKIKELNAQQKDAAKAEDMTLANTIQGQMNAYNDMLDEAISAEQLRADNAEAIVAKAGTKAGSFLDQCFGGDEGRFANEFKDGFKAEMKFPETPTVLDPALPVADRPLTAVYDTLAKSGTSANVEYYRLIEAVNAIKQWMQGDGPKPESGRKWAKFVANLTWLAAWMPVTRTAVSDHKQIEGILKNELPGDLSETKAREALQGTEEITGILNTPGIQQYTKKTDDNVYDSIRRMCTLARIKGRVIPQYAGMTPAVSEEMDLIKNDNGTYLRVNDGKRVWSLLTVEDEFLTTIDGSTTQEGAMVYAPNAATWYTAENDSVRVGLVDDQFIENEYTLLVESRNTLAVKKPAGFVYLPNALA